MRKILKKIIIENILSSALVSFIVMFLIGIMKLIEGEFDWKWEITMFFLGTALAFIADTFVDMYREVMCWLQKRRNH